MPDSHAEPIDSNPLDPSEADLSRIRERAYFLWEAEGRPEGRADDYWERARELDAMQFNAPAMQPNPLSQGPWRDPGAAPVEEAALQENLGEFPGRFTDQGEVMTTPATRKDAKAFRTGAR
jgi:hypothetical protein